MSASGCDSRSSHCQPSLSLGVCTCEELILAGMHLARCCSCACVVCQKPMGAIDLPSVSVLVWFYDQLSYLFKLVVTTPTSLHSSLVSTQRTHTAQDATATEQPHNITTTQHYTTRQHHGHHRRTSDHRAHQQADQLHPLRQQVGALLEAVRCYGHSPQRDRRIAGVHNDASHHASHYTYSTPHHVTTLLDSYSRTDLATVHMQINNTHAACLLFSWCMRT